MLLGLPLASTKVGIIIITIIRTRIQRRRRGTTDNNNHNDDSNNCDKNTNSNSNNHRNNGVNGTKIKKGKSRNSDNSDDVAIRTRKEEPSLLWLFNHLAMEILKMIIMMVTIMNSSVTVCLYNLIASWGLLDAWGKRLLKHVENSRTTSGMDPYPRRTFHRHGNPACIHVHTYIISAATGFWSYYRYQNLITHLYYYCHWYYIDYFRFYNTRKISLLISKYRK